MSTAGIDNIERLARAIEDAPESTTRAVALELIQAVLNVHGQAFARILALLEEQGAAGEQFIEILARDQLISSLLALYALHPDTVNLRVERALLQIQETIANYRAEVRLVGVSDEGVVRVRVTGVSRAAAGRLRTVLEDALSAAAPDANQIVIEHESGAGFVPIGSLLSNNGR